MSTNGQSKSNHGRLAHQRCHPECNEGSRHEILRSAQNDKAEWSQSKVYQCHVVRFRVSESRVKSRKDAHLTDIEPLAWVIAAGFEFLDQLTYRRDRSFKDGHCAAKRLR